MRITERVVVQEIVFPSGIVLPAAFDAVLPLYLNDENRSALISRVADVRVFDGGVASFDAYFNRLHAGYWARFGDLKTVFLELSTEGRGICPCCGPHRRKVPCPQSGTRSFGRHLGEPRPCGHLGGGTLWFELRACRGDLVLREASWTTEPPGTTGTSWWTSRSAPPSAPKTWSAVCRA